MPHPLSAYLRALEAESLISSHTVTTQAADTAISRVTYDSRETCPGTLFICKGAHFRESFLAGALASGAVAWVAEASVGEGLASALPEAAAAPHIFVSDIRAALVALADTAFDRVSDKLHIAGATGTKGKSTTTYFMRYILNEWMAETCKPECAVLSSIDNYDGVSTEEAHLTTPEVLELYRHFQNAVDSGITHLTMEVSSQALMMGRVAGVTYDVGAWLNIDKDHISPVEHASFEDYFAAKLKLFDLCRVACVNTDARFAGQAIEYAKERCDVVTFGSHEDDTVRCLGIERRADGIFFTVASPAYNGEFSITMPGLFNVQNALAAIAMSMVLGVPEDCVRRGLAKGRATGRMQVYPTADGQATVIVDYAHNRLSFEALLSSTQAEYPGHAIIWVFGCPGNHAQNLRQDLPGVIGNACEMAYICEEDSASEPFADIAADIAAEMASPYRIIEDRGECIRRALFDHDGPRVILVTGKGEERYMKRAGGYEDCLSDVELTLAHLAAYDAAHPAQTRA